MLMNVLLANFEVKNQSSKSVGLYLMNEHQSQTNMYLISVLILIVINHSGCLEVVKKVIETCFCVLL